MATESAKRCISPLPDVIKIDVEGFEEQVIAGLSQTIAQKRPVIAFEHIFLSDNQVRGVVPKDYGLVFIRDDGKLTGEFEARGNSHDALLVPKEKMNLLGEFSHGKAGTGDLGQRHNT